MAENTKVAEEDMSLDCLKSRLENLYGYLGTVLTQAQSVEEIGILFPKEAKAETRPPEAKQDFPLLEELHRSVDRVQKRIDIIRDTLARALKRLRKKK